MSFRKNWDPASRLIGFGLDAAVAGLFIGMGILGRKRHRWIVIIGMILYALDGLIFLWLEAWMNLAFHAFALFGLWKGLKALNKLNALEQGIAVE